MIISKAANRAQEPAVRQAVQGDSRAGADWEALGVAWHDESLLPVLGGHPRIAMRRSQEDKPIRVRPY